MEGLFVIIAIVIGILDFAAKQKKRQGGGSGNNRGKPQRSSKRLQMDIPEPLRKAMMELERGWNEEPEVKVRNESKVAEDYGEGVEHENRSSTGSLVYAEQSRSQEGECDEHTFHRSKDRVIFNEDNGALPVEILHEPLFDITEEELIKSVVMAEILGPPRALKGRIR